MKHYELISLAFCMGMAIIFPICFAQKNFLIFTVVGKIFCSIIEIGLLAGVFYILRKYEVANKYVLCVTGAAGFAFMI
jgi:hypothetical protein